MIFTEVSKEIRLRYQYNALNKPKYLLRNIVSSILMLIVFKKSQDKTPIFEYEISTRLYNAFRFYFFDRNVKGIPAKIITVADIKEIDINIFKKQPNVGKKTIDELDKLMKVILKK